MTTPLIPDFIITLFENEIRSIINQVIHVIATNLSLDQDEVSRVVSKQINLSLEIVQPNEEVVKIIKIKPRKIPDTNERCIANVRRKGIICQCCFKKTDKDLCKRHAASLKFGTINDAKPPPQIVTKPKRKIY